MTKQQDIREGLAAHLLPYMIPHYKNNHDLADSVFDEVLTYLASQGAVLKVEKELPKMLLSDDSDEDNIRLYNGNLPTWATDPIIEAGWSATEPLIDEEK